MSKFRKAESPGKEHYEFICPGCKEWHVVYVKGFNLSWSFNGDINRPTVSPSLLLHHDGYPKENIPPYRCHSFIKNGMIHFLNDCTHELKGLTVPLPDIPNA